MARMRGVKHYLIDLNGVIYRGGTLVPGADRFVGLLEKLNRKFLFLTNSSESTPSDLQQRLSTMGIRTPVERFQTAAMATASFLQSQRPEGGAFVIGEQALRGALSQAGYRLTEKDPDYVVLGETRTYDFSMLTRAIRLIKDGVPFIATNPDISGPWDVEITPGCGSLAALIERATGKTPYYVGKPNPLIVQYAMRALDVHPRETAIVGDQMETDIAAGVGSGIVTILVLSGITNRENIPNYPYRPDFVFDSIADIDL
jgi:NagD protein